MRNFKTTLVIEISLAVSGYEVMVHSVQYNCHAWDNGESDPQLMDYGTYANRDPKQVHPAWVTTEMLYHADAAAMIEFVNSMEKYETSREDAA